jgi:hypothetical protein
VLEKTISELIIRCHRQLWPDLDMRFVETERSLNAGRLDIVFEQADGSLLVLELKNATVTPAAVQQVYRYVQELQGLEPRRTVYGMAAAPTVSMAGAREAAQLGVMIRPIDMHLLASLASGLGLAVAHDSGHRPRLRGSAAGSRTSAPAKSRSSTPPEIVEHLRSLHQQFPPGTLNATTSHRTLERYWRQACPRTSVERLAQVVELTALALSLVPGSALGPRTQSRSRGWATVRAPDGRVVASFEARANRADVSFYAVQEDVDRLTAAGGARLWGPRGYCFWLDCFVGPGGLSLQEALTLLRKGTAFEFDLRA